MKIGILTYQNAHNYGAILQLTALKTYLENCGYEVETINYINQNIDKQYTKLPKYRFVHHSMKTTILSLVRLPLFWIKFAYSARSQMKRYQKFKAFLKELNPTEEATRIEQLDLNQYDFIICGSDQIWNPILTGGLDKVYFADFDTKAVKISYAVSMGLKELPRLEENKFHDWVNNFDAISVRETSLKEYCEKFTEKDIHVVVDPTLLLNENDYEKYIDKPKLDNYVLVYTLSEDKRLLQMAKELAQKSNSAVIELRDGKKITHMKNCQIADAGPREFLGLIKYAKSVVTNSFHGTIFSVIFETDIYILKSHWASSRLESLVKLLKIENRYIDKLSDAKKINFKVAKKNIIKARETSIEFLDNAFKIQKSRRVSKVCMGCTACLNACPHQAIFMQTDKEGFQYAVIDESECRHCDICKEICPLLNKVTLNSKQDIVYGVKASDSIRKLSQSGGMGYQLAQSFLEKHGKVFGAILDDQLHVIHQQVDEHKIAKLNGSKYVQSDLKTVFKEVKESTKRHKTLFIGTPCQIAGLKAYVESDNLYTVDLICHGVPSPKIYHDYLIYLEKKYKKQIKKIDFRDKRYGWGAHFETIFFENKEITTNHYANIFNTSKALRPYCYQCKFAKKERVGDLTIGDLWGIEQKDASYLDGLGISYVTVNSDKGKELWKSIKDKITKKEYSAEEFVQHNLHSPTIKPDDREQFWKDYDNVSFNEIIKKYGHKSKKHEINIKIIIWKRKLKRTLKQMLHK